MDERIAREWSSPHVLSIVFFQLNNTMSSETGVVPFHAHFGSSDETYHKLPENLPPDKAAHEYLKLLDNNLAAIKDASTIFQQALVKQRVPANQELIQNKFKAGEFVLFKRSMDGNLPSKLSSPLLGPYRVLSQRKNDVECRSLIHGNIQFFHVDRLTLFLGTEAEARETALIDQDQHFVDVVLAYHGDVTARTHMSFEVRFMDGDVRWLPFKEISDTIQFEDFCRARPPLVRLLTTIKIGDQLDMSLNRSKIVTVQPGMRFFLDVRDLGNAQWYDEVDLPNKFHVQYLLPCVYTQWDNAKQTKITFHCDLLGLSFQKQKHTWVNANGSMFSLPQYDHVVLDANWIVDYPDLLDNDNRQSQLKKLKAIVAKKSPYAGKAGSRP
jgi:hypothetical protein